MAGGLRRRASWVLDRRFGDLRSRIDYLGDLLVGVAYTAEATRATAARAADQTTGDALAAAGAPLRTEVGDVRAVVGDVLAELRGLRAELAATQADVAALRDLLPPVLRAIVTEETANRRRLDELRADPEYAVPFEHPDPLVTVCVPTHDRIGMLTERSLPSVLAQTHRRLEVLVVGDASPPEVAVAVAALGDERIRFVNLTQRHAATDAERHWLVGSVPARNAGYALARGHWVVDFDDDDAMRPDAIERVLATARAERREVVYGKLAAHFADGRTEIVGQFPPTVHRFGWQGAVVHRGLGFLGRELVAAAFGHPNDWFRVESMMRIGVRFAMVDHVLYDYYPARSWRHEEAIPQSAFVEEHAW